MSSQNPPECDEPARTKQQCWEESINETLHKKGLEATFALFAHFYATEPSFASQGCHWYAHKIGEYVYRLFKQGKPFTLVPEVSYCGYGFFHGFMEFLLHDDPNLEHAKEFCGLVEKELSAKAPRSRINCYHGIGHGFVEDPPDKRFWGNPDAMIKKSLEICEHISPNPIETKECSEGAFNAVILLMEQGKYGLSLEKDNFFRFCNDQPRTYRLYCYYEMAQKLDSLSNRSLPKIGEFAKTIPDDQDGHIAEMVVGTGAAALMQSDIIKEDHTDYIFACRKLGSRLALPCIKGVIGGFLAHGEPDKEYIKALAFCRSPELLSDERSACYEHLTIRLKSIYAREKVNTICATVEEPYRTLCQYN
ncbi:MAG: hypothetical protein HY006_02415 [Candidatus Sungbacteria bacterium]|nr:hypothetical protein [Candidatus Sungbacteria bacterium]